MKSLIPPLGAVGFAVFLTVVLVLGTKETKEGKAKPLVRLGDRTGITDAGEQTDPSDSLRTCRPRPPHGAFGAGGALVAGSLIIAAPLPRARFSAPAAWHRGCPADEGRRCEGSGVLSTAA
ncbi:hypothetical protein [Streptomyces canus]|uniref:hypothetical protein n=1 Tax=Streptomyces canus TaxID=58343 RepID=UPI002E36B8F1|nr:hypothetical protein [Streptomyces canus]